MCAPLPTELFVDVAGSMNEVTTLPAKQLLLTTYNAGAQRRSSPAGRGPSDWSALLGIGLLFNLSKCRICSERSNYLCNQRIIDLKFVSTEHPV
jgi:hypothetical protein